MKLVATAVRARRSPRQAQIIQTLRTEIVSGKLAPGARLSSQLEVAERFGVSAVTAQLALQRLAQEGFIEPRKSRGTFVVDKPPHLNNYALVFWNDPTALLGSLFWSKYYTALTNAARELQQRDKRRLLLFHGVDHHVDSEDHQRLIAHIESQQLAGIIFANNPYPLLGTPILELPGIPRVVLAGGLMSPGLSTVELDGTSWRAKALDHLRAQGRRRIALVTPGLLPQDDDLLTALAAARGLQFPSRWRQIVPLNDPRALRNCLDLLMAGKGPARPDGLLVMDDNFSEVAQAALVAARVRVPAEVAVVTHCNFPWPPSDALPVKRLGYDIRRVLRTCLELIDCQRRGERVPVLTRMPALFEDELNDRQTAAAVAAAPVRMNGDSR